MSRKTERAKNETLPDTSGWLPDGLKSSEGTNGLTAALFEGNPDLVFVVDSGGRIVAANSRALSEFGYTRAQLHGQPIHFLLPPEARDRHAAHLLRYLQHPTARAMGSGMDLKACDAHGNQFPVDILLWPFTSGGNRYVVGVCHRLDASLARSQMQIHAMVESSQDSAVTLLDCDGRILTWNAGAARAYNLSASETLGKHFSVLFSPEEIAAGQPELQLQVAAQSRLPFRSTGWRSGTDGQILWYEGELRATRDLSGQVDGFTQVLHDLTQSKRTEEKLRKANCALAESEQVFRMLVESVTDYAVYMLDPHGHVITWNAGAEHGKGYRKEEILGKSFSIFFTPEGRDAGRPALELAAAERDGHFETQDWRIRKDGSRFWALVSLTAIRSENGELRGFAKVTRDMTAQRSLEEAREKLALDLEERVTERTRQLEASVEELRTKNEEIEALVAMVSHDLGEKEVLLREVYHRVKNNLQVVQSLLKMGVRTLQPSDARAAVETAVQRVHVMAMVHEHLYQMPDLSGLTLSAFLRDVVEGAIASNSERPDRVQLQLEVDDIPVPLDFAIPLGLLANELVSNCLKHGIPSGKTGKISVSARRIPGALRFSVRDDGPGLPPNFDTAKFTSMGLKLAGSLAHQLGGRLEFTSSDGCLVRTELARLTFQPGSPVPLAGMAHSAPAPWMSQRKAQRDSVRKASRDFTDPSCFLS